MSDDATPDDAVVEAAVDAFYKAECESGAHTAFRPRTESMRAAIRAVDEARAGMLRSLVDTYGDAEREFGHDENDATMEQRDRAVFNLYAALGITNGIVEPLLVGARAAGIREAVENLRDAAFEYGQETIIADQPWATSGAESDAQQRTSDARADLLRRVGIVGNE